jgi:hypothetical protein
MRCRPISNGSSARPVSNTIASATTTSGSFPNSRPRFRRVKSATVPRSEQFDVRCSFESPGLFVGAREAQARSRRLYAQLRAEGKGAAARSKTVAPQTVRCLKPSSEDPA